MLQFMEIFRKNYYLKRGLNLLRQGKPEEALPYLEKVLMLDDSAPNMYNLALTLLALQRYEEAEKYHKKILLDHPHNELATLTLAELYMQKREWDKAKELLIKLTEQHPTNKNYKKYLLRLNNPQSRENYIKAKELLNEAQVLLVRKDLEKALQVLLEAERYDPENPYIQNNIGSFYLLLRKAPKKALTYFQRAYQLEPENLKFRNNLYRVRKLIRQ